MKVKATRSFSGKHGIIRVNEQRTDLPDDYVNDCIKKGLLVEIKPERKKKSDSD